MISGNFQRFMHPSPICKSRLSLISMSFCSWVDHAIQDQHKHALQALFCDSPKASRTYNRSMCFSGGYLQGRGQMHPLHSRENNLGCKILLQGFLLLWDPLTTASYHVAGLVFFLLVMPSSLLPNFLLLF